jgi:hypothetical protein
MDTRFAAKSLCSMGAFQGPMRKSLWSDLSLLGNMAFNGDYTLGTTFPNLITCCD